MQARTDRQAQPAQAQMKHKMGLLNAIAHIKNADLVAAWIDKIPRAEIDFMGVPFRALGGGPSKETALALAVRVGHVTATQLLLAHGANPEGSLTLSNRAIIVEAVISGKHLIVEALLAKAPYLVEAVGDRHDLHTINHLHNAIFALYPYTIIQDGVWESEALQYTLIDYWDTKAADIPNRPLTVHYSGNEDVVNTLLNYHARLVLMKTLEGFSPLDIVLNPSAYPQHFFDISGEETIRYLGLAEDQDPSVLVFEIDLADRDGRRRFSDPPEIADGVNRPLVRVIFDFKPLQKLLRARAERLPDFSLIQALGTVDQHIVRVGQDIQAVQGTVQQHARQLRLVDEHFLAPLEEETRFQAWLAEPRHENLKIFHDAIDTRFRVLIHGFHGIASNMLQVNVSDQHLGALRTVLGGLSTLVNIAPMVPGVATGLSLFKKGADKVAEIRQRNVAYCVASFADETKMAALRKRLTRRLTQAYTQPLLLLADPMTAELSQGAIQKKLQQGRQALLNSPFLSPAEQAAMFVMLWIVDYLHEAPEIAAEVRSKGLDEVLFSLILQRNPPEKLRTFWAKELVRKAFGSELLSKTGKTWDARAFFSAPGLCVMQEGNLQYYSASHSNPSVYGWRLVSAQDVEALPNFRRVPDHKAPSFRPPWFSEGRPDPTAPTFVPGYDAVRRSSQSSQDPLVARGEQVPMPRLSNKQGKG